MTTLQSRFRALRVSKTIPVSLFNPNIFCWCLAFRSNLSLGEIISLFQQMSILLAQYNHKLLKLPQHDKTQWSEFQLRVFLFYDTTFDRKWKMFGFQVNDIHIYRPKTPFIFKQHWLQLKEMFYYVYTDCNKVQLLFAKQQIQPWL